MSFGHTSGLETVWTHTNFDGCSSKKWNEDGEEEWQGELFRKKKIEKPKVKLSDYKNNNANSFMVLTIGIIDKLSRSIKF